MVTNVLIASMHTAAKVPHSTKADSTMDDIELLIFNLLLPFQAIVREKNQATFEELFINT